MLEIDSTFCKVHQNACSGKKDQAIGVSRGGKNTKIHVIINERMQLLNVVLTGGQVHEIHFFIAEHEAVACIPDKTNFKIKHDFDSELYKQRNIVE